MPSPALALAIAFATASSLTTKELSSNRLEEPSCSTFTTEQIVDLGGQVVFSRFTVASLVKARRKVYRGVGVVISVISCSSLFVRDTRHVRVFTCCLAPFLALMLAASMLAVITSLRIAMPLLTWIAALCILLTPRGIWRMCNVRL